MTTTAFDNYEVNYLGLGTDLVEVWMPQFAAVSATAKDSINAISILHSHWHNYKRKYEDNELIMPSPTLIHRCAYKWDYYTDCVDLEVPSYLYGKTFYTDHMNSLQLHFYAGMMGGFSSRERCVCHHGNMMRRILADPDELSALQAACDNYVAYACRDGAVSRDPDIRANHMVHLFEHGARFFIVPMSKNTDLEQQDKLKELALKETTP